MSELLSNLDLERSTRSSDAGAASIPAEKGPSKTQHIEQAIILLADAVWALVGLFLWIPQIVRVVFTTALRLVHAALTRQPIESIRGPIRQVSRFYLDGFLSPGRETTPGGYGSRQLQLGRFVTEAIWVAAVWLAILRLANPRAFTGVWQSLVGFSTWVWDVLTAGAQMAMEQMPEGYQIFMSVGPMPAIVLGVSLLIVLIGGFFLGRRSR